MTVQKLPLTIFPLLSKDLGTGVELALQLLVRQSISGRLSEPKKNIVQPNRLDPVPVVMYEFWVYCTVYTTLQVLLV
jgi:hypothetical protein